MERYNLGATFGSMWSVYEADIFFSMVVRPLPNKYRLEPANALHFDQPHLVFDQAWYTGPQAAKARQYLQEYVHNIFLGYQSALNQPVDGNTIDKDVQDVVDYEFRLASQFLENEYTRTPDYKRIRYAVNLTDEQGRFQF